MTQEERSQRSRAQILDAALALFSRQGYRATSMREIADKAGVSTGSVYHHFKDKETIFRALLDVYWQAIEDPDFPVNRALRTGSFPENLEDIGRAARESVARYPWWEKSPSAASRICARLRCERSSCVIMPP